MKVSRSKLAVMIAEKLENASDTKAFSKDIAAYLLSEGRISELDSILRDVMQYRSDNGTVEVISTDAFVLSSALRENIKQVVSKLYPNSSKIIISEVIDPSVIGGVRLEFANSQLDLSVRAKLNHFKQLTATAGGI